MIANAERKLTSTTILDVYGKSILDMECKFSPAFSSELLFIPYK
jgi:hypothetical protein